MIPSSTVQPSVVFLGEELRRRGQTSAVLATLKWRTPRIGSAVTTFITACMHRYLSAGMPLLKKDLRMIGLPVKLVMLVCTLSHPSHQIIHLINTLSMPALQLISSYICATYSS